MPFNSIMQLGAQTAGADPRQNVYATSTSAPYLWQDAAAAGWQPFMRQRVPPPRLLPFLAREQDVPPFLAREPPSLFAAPPPLRSRPCVFMVARSCA